MSITLSQEMFNQIVAKACAEAVAAQMPRTPVPGSLAAPAIAQGPPAPPPAPAPQVIQYREPDLTRALHNVMTHWLPNRNWEHAALVEFAQMLYAEDPSNFRILGGVHTTPDGSRSYFSVSHMKYGRCGANFTLHLYGSLRGTMFRVNQIDMKTNTQLYEKIAYNTLSDSENSSTA